MNLIHIIKGWGKSIGILSVSTAEKKLSDLRLKHCSGCPLSATSKFLEIVNGHAKYEHRLVCTKCKCPCLEKSLVVDEKCPVGLW